MGVASIGLLILDLIEEVPDAIAAVRSLFESKPDATLDDLNAVVAEYRSVAAERKAAVAESHEIFGGSQ